MLAAAALEEMREALRLQDAALYLPDADGTRCCAATSARPAQELSFDEEAWRLAVASGAPIVLREAASWLVENPFTPPATNWVILPLVTGERVMVGVVIASAAQPIRIDPLSGTVLTLLGLQLSAGITTAQLRRELLHAAMERERRQLAAEVHDGLAQYLACARRELALPEPDRARLTEAVDAAHRLVRDRLQDLSADAPADLRQAIARAARRSRANVRVTGRGEAGPEAVTLAARVVSEARGQRGRARATRRWSRSPTRPATSASS